MPDFLIQKMNGYRSRRHCRWQGYTVNEEDVSHTHTLPDQPSLYTPLPRTPTHTKYQEFIDTLHRGPYKDQRRMISSFFCATQCSVFSSISNVEQISSRRMYVCFFLFFSTLYTFLITSRSRMAYISLMVEQKFNQHTSIQKIFLFIFNYLRPIFTKCHKFSHNIISRHFQS